MPPAYCRDDEAVTLRQFANRREGLLQQIAPAAHVVTLFVDVASVVAHANHVPNSDWDEISEDTLKFLFCLCVTFGLSLSVQSAEVQKRMLALYSRQGLQELDDGALAAFGPVAFPLQRYVLPIGGTDVSVDVVPHPTYWWPLSQAICFRRYQVGTPPQWLARHPASGLAGPRRGFVQAWLLRNLVPDDLGDMFDDVLDTREMEFYAELVGAFASQQAEQFVLLLAEQRTDAAGLKRLLLEWFSESASAAIRFALVDSSSRRHEAELALKLQLTAEAVTHTLAGTGPAVLLRLPGDSGLRWELKDVLGQLRKSGKLGWLPLNPAKESMPKLVGEVLRFMFSSEGGTLGAAAVLTRAPAPASLAPRAPRPPARALWTGGLAPAGSSRPCRRRWAAPGLGEFWRVV
jgi:hypothetical protein